MALGGEIFVQSSGKGGCAFVDLDGDCVFRQGRRAIPVFRRVTLVFGVGTVGPCTFDGSEMADCGDGGWWRLATTTSFQLEFGGRGEEEEVGDWVRVRDGVGRGGSGAGLISGEGGGGGGIWRRLGIEGGGGGDGGWVLGKTEAGRGLRIRGGGGGDGGSGLIPGNKGGGMGQGGGGGVIWHGRVAAVERGI